MKIIARMVANKPANDLREICFVTVQTYIRYLDILYVKLTINNVEHQLNRVS